MRMAKIRQTDNYKCWEDEEHIELLYIAGGSMNWYSYFRKLTVSTKLNICISCNIAMLPQGINPI